MAAAVCHEELVRLSDEIAETAAHIDAAIHTLLTQIRAFDAADGWHHLGAVSCAHYLSWRIGMDLGAAREKVRVARALGELPAIDDALRRGELSYSKVRAMTRVATPANEPVLLELARACPAAHLEKLCRLYRGAQRQSPNAARDRADQRWVNTRETAGGMVQIVIQVEPDEAQVVLAAIDACRADRSGRADATTGDVEPEPTRPMMRSRVDAVMAMAEAAVRGDKPERSPTEVVVHIDADTLEGHLEDGTGVSAETARRLCCDAGLVPTLDDADGNTLNVGRKTRTIPGALRRALKLRDGGCRFPGCTHRITDAHHIVHWADGGETSLANTLLACRVHHRFLHEHGYAVSRDPATGDVVFTDPAGQPIPPTGPRPCLGDNADARLRAAAVARGIDIDAETSLPNWWGERVDYHDAVSFLALADATGSAPSRRRP
jgi:hypothetical protein